MKAVNKRGGMPTLSNGGKQDKYNGSVSTKITPAKSGK